MRLEDFAARFTWEENVRVVLTCATVLSVQHVAGSSGETNKEENPHERDSTNRGNQ